MIIHEDKKISGLFPEVKHGFLGRNGGVSKGTYASLNCAPASADERSDVKENRAIVARGFGLGDSDLITLKQIHSDKCYIVDKAFDEEFVEGDALVTEVPGLLLGALSADCAPVLFSGRKKDGKVVVGAAHSGWGGAVGGVLEATVSSMGELGVESENIYACVGPCIGPASYEVSEGFEKPFLEHSPDSERFFRSGRSEDKLMFDLPGYVAWRLSGCGVRNVSISGVDTLPDEGNLFSYRRSQLAGEADYGRQISIICIAK
jgi:YfiH family protein